MYTLRRASLSDIDKLIEFRIKFLNELQDYPPNKEFEIFCNSIRDFFIKKMNENEFVAWLAESNNKIIATSGLSFLQKPPHFINITGKFAYIMNMYTKPEWRRKGIGAALLKKLFEEIKERGIKSVVLHSTPSGKTLYEKYGFRENLGDKEMILEL